VINYIISITNKERVQAMQTNIVLTSIYLSILNATMILRSIGKTFKENGYKNKTKRKERIKEYRKVLFEILNTLVRKMDRKTLTEKEIIKNIEVIAKKFGISIGQSQKAINVILKCHYYLFHEKNKKLKRILHCPLDSIILKKISKKDSLTGIRSVNKYINLQEMIQRKEKGKAKIEFDIKWDKINLKEAGIYPFKD
jgi:hypothetical protein